VHAYTSFSNDVIDSFSHPDFYCRL